MSTTNISLRGEASRVAPDDAKIAQLSAELQAAREARAAADAATAAALRTYNRTRA